MIRIFVYAITTLMLVGMGPVLPDATAQVKPNEVTFRNTDFVNGAVGVDTQGIIRTIHDPSLDEAANPLFDVDENGIPTQFDTFILFPGAFLDSEVVANDKDFLTGVMLLDKFAAVHTVRFNTLGDVAPDPENPITAADAGPQIDFKQGAAEFNATNPDNPVFFPYFPFNVEIPTASDGVARDLEVAIDWRNATNAFQGYYILDAFAGVHYVNNPPVLAMLSRNNEIAGDGPYTVGMNKFFEIFNFRTNYLLDFDGLDEEGNAKTRPAPYFIDFPIARDIEVLTRFVGLDTDKIEESQTRAQLAQDENIDSASLFQPIEMPFARLDRSSEKFADAVPIPTGYAILDGFGAIHSLIEDEEGNVIPAPWEDEANGMVPDAPFFSPFDLAIDIEVMPNGGGLLLLNRLGEVFVINALDKTDADNFATGDSSILDNLPVFGFDAARDLTIMSNDVGKIVGVYVTDRFGGVHRAGRAPRLPGEKLFFASGNARSLNVSPMARPVTAPQPITTAQTVTSPQPVTSPQ